jgi:hypothetical protein
MFWTGPKSLTVTCPEGRLYARQVAAAADGIMRKLMLSPAAAKTGCEAILTKPIANAKAIAMAAIVGSKLLIIFLFMGIH